MPLDKCIGVQRNRLGGLVLDAIGHRKHVTVIHRDFTVKHEALAIVVGERHGRCFSQRIMIGLPQRIGRGQDKIRAGIGDEARLGVIRRRRTRGREQNDVRTVRIDRLAVGLKRHVVDAPALERDRSVDRGGVELDPGTFGQGIGTALLRRRCFPLRRRAQTGRWRTRGLGIAHLRPRLRPRGCARVHFSLGLPLLVEMRPGIKRVPPKNDEQRKTGRYHDVSGFRGHPLGFLPLERRRRASSASPAARPSRSRRIGGEFFRVPIIPSARISSPCKARNGMLSASGRARIT